MRSESQDSMCYSSYCYFPGHPVYIERFQRRYDDDRNSIPHYRARAYHSALIAFTIIRYARNTLAACAPQDTVLFYVYDRVRSRTGSETASPLVYSSPMCPVGEHTAARVLPCFLPQSDSAARSFGRDYVGPSFPYPGNPARHLSPSLALILSRRCRCLGDKNI